jgi:radical SAM superfamily enzyme YgiQ (UPF0313 family)
MKVNKIVFLIPNSGWFDNRAWYVFPYTVGLLAAVLNKEGYEVSVIDANMEDLSEDDVIKRLESMKPDVAAISALTIMYKKCVHRSFELVKAVNKDIVTVLGGIYPTLSPQIAMKDFNIDYIVLGEGEERMVSLLKAIEGGRGFDKIDGLAYRRAGEMAFSVNPRVSIIEDLNVLPFPNYKIFDMKKYTNYKHKFTHNFMVRQFPFAETMTSRGCPYNCVFCSSRKLYGHKIRYRTPKNVLDEIDMLVKDYGVREMIFVDDSFLQSKQRALEIMRGIIDRGDGLLWKPIHLSGFLIDDEILEMLRKSGCYQATIPIESGCPRTLRRMRKPTNLDKLKKAVARVKEFGFEVISNFIIGFPGETMDEIRETFQCAEELDIDYVLFSITTPLPETDLYELCKEYKCIPQDFNFEAFDFCGFGRSVITTEEFHPFELQVLRAFEWDRINFNIDEKKAKIAKMLGVTLEELDKWRRETRQKIGVDIKSINKEAVC